MSQLTLPEQARLAVRLAEEAGRLTLGYFQQNTAVDLKGDGTPVTAADRGAENFLRQALAEHFPDDGILGEEFGDKETPNNRTWIIDPIDGTKSFVRGVPLYGVLIGLEEEGDSQLGVIHFPALKETVHAWRGGGCWWNGNRTQVSAVQQLDQSMLLLSDIHRQDLFGELQERVPLRRTWGDCYGYALVATGRAEIMCDPEINVWDIAAVQPIIEEAGGRFSDLDGKATLRGRGALATNGHIHDEVLKALQRQ